MATKTAPPGRGLIGALGFATPFNGRDAAPRRQRTRSKSLPCRTFESLFGVEVTGGWQHRPVGRSHTSIFARSTSAPLASRSRCRSRLRWQSGAEQKAWSGTCGRGSKGWPQCAQRLVIVVVSMQIPHGNCNSSDAGPERWPCAPISIWKAWDEPVSVPARISWWNMCRNF